MSCEPLKPLDLEAKIQNSHEPSHDAGAVHGAVTLSVGGDDQRNLPSMVCDFPSCRPPMRGNLVRCSAHPEGGRSKEEANSKEPEAPQKEDPETGQLYDGASLQL